MYDPWYFGSETHATASLQLGACCVYSFCGVGGRQMQAALVHAVGGMLAW